MTWIRGWWSGALLGSSDTVAGSCRVLSWAATTRRAEPKK